ncbi:MAG: N-6 DNA methylase [Thermodesulfobacteriota bacterium]
MTNKNSNLEHQESLQRVADSLVGATQELMRGAKTEEDLRIGFEKILAPILKSIGVESPPRYERLGAEARTIYRGRPDAVHGQVIIEYEAPGAFSSESAVVHAHDQLVNYMSAEAHGHKADPLSLLNRLVGVGFNGAVIFFVHYQQRKKAKKTTIQKDAFMRRGPYPFNLESARTLLTYLRALARLPLSAENLADKFGPKSKIAPLAVSAFLDALKHWGDQRVQVFFNEWKRLFGIVYGEQFTAQQVRETEQLSLIYGINQDTDFKELLFSVHTYFAFLMKLIAAELIYLKDSSFTFSFSHQITHASRDDFKGQLEDIENGGIYAKQGITNFLEGDFFRWYLDAFPPRLEEALREIARTLSEFEPATTSIDPEATRDLLKKLYQYLVPKEVRHKLGEYYTPDWLAELILNEVGYKGNTLKRLLDPACGSGTFLVLAIQKAKKYARTHKEPPLETAKRIVANIWGFDLNPLAVIASRTNYLFALGDLVQELQSLEIPIYLADSVLWPQKTGQIELNFVGGEYIKIKTSLEQFHVPYIWVKDEGFLMRQAAPLVEKLTKLKYSVTEAIELFKKEGLVFPPHENIVKTFYEEILELEKQGKNGIWARFLKNAFAPVIAGRFDFVVGNPPWIRWDFLSQEYRQATLPLWKDYGLFSLKGFATRLGGAKKDFSMLFTYASSDYYLKDAGILGFLITQEVFKSKGAGEGFRRFRLGESGKPLKVLKAHDLVTVQPFEGAANKSAAIILKKGEETIYSVPYFIWQKKKGVGKIATDKTLSDVLPSLTKKKNIAQPIGSKIGAWKTVTDDFELHTKIEGKNYYKAHSGAYTSPYGVFWINIEQILSDSNLIISNLSDKGKRIIAIVQDTIESDLVFPSIRGSDIDRWIAIPKIYTLITQDPKIRKGYNERLMKNKWPRTYGYLTRFKNVLLSQAAYKKYHSESNNPFYSQYNISEYTFSNYKVIWKQMSNDIFASVISQIKTPFNFKIIVPLHTTALIATNDENEAHYLCSIINSHPVRSFIRSFSAAGRGFGTPSVMNHVGIPKFDPKNELHQKLAQLSKTLHDLKANNRTAEIPELEIEVDRYVYALFGIRND